MTIIAYRRKIETAIGPLTEEEADMVEDFHRDNWTIAMAIKLLLKWRH